MFFRYHSHLEVKRFMCTYFLDCIYKMLLNGMKARADRPFCSSRGKRSGVVSSFFAYFNFSVALIFFYKMTTEKRAIDKDNLLFNVSAVLVDIEGTTTSINFVKETLFPYVREHLEEYVNSKWSEEELKADVALLRDQAVKDTEDKVEGVVNIPEGEGDEVKTSVINNVLWQMDGDRKTKALKQLQGHIWRNGYSSGKIIGHLYDDVKDCLKSWSEAGKKIFVYSSGSVEAQKLLFGNTKDGDLLSIFSGHFDTEVGPKTESSSYVKILKQLKESSHVANDPKDVLFLTDVPKEAQAATDAGMQVAVVIREGNAPLPDDIKDTFPTISSFSDLIFEGINKKKRIHK